MICTRCLHRSALRPLRRQFTTSTHPRDASSATPSPRTTGAPAATSTGTAQPFSTPLSPTPNAVSLGASLRPKPKTSTTIPISIAPAGSQLKGLNYMKGKEDPVALDEHEYPEWLWTVLDAKVTDEGANEQDADMFSKSKKLRRKAAKRQRKLEERLLASGDMEALAPKVPITRQTIDLPSNEEGSVEGALEAERRREELTEAMRQDRRKAIKEKNFLKGV